MVILRDLQVMSLRQTMMNQDLPEPGRSVLNHDPTDPARAGNGSTPPTSGPRTPQPIMDVDSISPTAPFHSSTLHPAPNAYGPVAPHAVDHRGNPMAPPPALRGEAEAYAIGGAGAYAIGGAGAYALGGAGAHAIIPHVPPTLRTIHDDTLLSAANTLPGTDSTPAYHALRARMMQLERNDFEMKQDMRRYVNAREQGL